MWLELVPLLDVSCPRSNICHSHIREWSFPPKDKTYFPLFLHNLHIGQIGHATNILVRDLCHTSIRNILTLIEKCAWVLACKYPFNLIKMSCFDLIKPSYFTFPIMTYMSKLVHLWLEINEISWIIFFFSEESKSNLTCFSRHILLD